MTAAPASNGSPGAAGAGAGSGAAAGAGAAAKSPNGSNADPSGVSAATAGSAGGAAGTAGGDRRRRRHAGGGLGGANRRGRGEQAARGFVSVRAASRRGRGGGRLRFAPAVRARQSVRRRGGRGGPGGGGERRLVQRLARVRQQVEGVLLGGDGRGVGRLFAPQRREVRVPLGRGVRRPFLLGPDLVVGPGGRLVPGQPAGRRGVQTHLPQPREPDPAEDHRGRRGGPDDPVRPRALVGARPIERRGERGPRFAGRARESVRRRIGIGRVRLFRRPPVAGRSGRGGERIGGAIGARPVHRANPGKTTEPPP